MSAIKVFIKMLPQARLMADVACGFHRQISGHGHARKVMAPVRAN